MGNDTTIYVVQPGDWLAKIAEEHGTTWQAIWNHPRNAKVKAKNGSPDRIYPGDVLHIPVASPQPTPPAPPAPPQPSGPPPPPPAGEDDWPYGPLPAEFQRRQPTWKCPDGTCECNPTDEPEEATRRHTIFFHDQLAERMKNARVRVHLNAERIEAPKRANADGSLEIEVPEDTTQLILEWAPHDTPLLPHLPFRKRYRLDVADAVGRGVDQRLQHLGYDSPPPRRASPGRSLSRRVTFFQADYGLPVDGRPEKVIDVLRDFHDHAQLPPLPPGRRDDPPQRPPGQPVPPLPPDTRGSQGAVAMLQPAFPRGAITVSDISGLAPLELVFLIQGERRLPRWFRDCLTLGAKFRLEAHIDLEHDAARKTENERLKAARRLTERHIAVLDAAIRAIQSDKWHVATGATQFVPLASFIATGIHPSDPPVDNTGPATQPELSKGEAITMPNLAVSQPTTRTDYHVDDKTAEPTPGRRASGRGFIWVSDTLQGNHEKTGELKRVTRSVLEVTEFFLHELACHADLINEGRLDDAKHVPGDTREADLRGATLLEILPSDAAAERTQLELMAAILESESDTEPEGQPS